MGIKFGEIDAGQIIQNEYRIGILEKVTEWILTNYPDFTNDLTPDMMAQFRNDVVIKLRDKYPSSEIELVGRPDQNE